MSFEIENEKCTKLKLQVIMNAVIMDKKKTTETCYRQRKTYSLTIKIIIVLSILSLIAIAVYVVYEIFKFYFIGNDFNEKWPIHSAEDVDYHKKLVDFVNNANSTWKAKYNPFASRARATDVDFDDMVRIADSNRMLTKEQLYGDTLSHLTNLLSISVKLPQNFDSREKWPLCWSVHQVTNQGGCGSCWAMSAASVISDRICIASNYEKQYQISAQDLTSCCTECGGCQGSHWALAPFTYWKKNGLVTGGNYGTFEGCKPYSITPKCGSPCSTDYYEKKATPKCEKKCQILYGKTYNDDIIKGKKAYWLRGNNETTPAVQTSITQAINNHDPIDLLKREIFLYGPIQACFTVQEDFQHYSSGIYHRFNNSDSKELYGHCAKMIGWGNSNGTEYWLYMNTWGREWGDNGFFRIALNEIPEEAIAGLP